MIITLILLYSLVIVVLTVLKLGGVLKLVFTLLIFSVLYFITLYLHEKCHQWFFEMLTGKKAVIRISYNKIALYCFPTVPVTVPIHIAACLAPLIVVAGTGVIFAISYLAGVPYWIKSALAFLTITSFSGSSFDIYWVILERRLPSYYLIVDHGTYAEVYAPSKDINPYS